MQFQGECVLRILGLSHARGKLDSSRRLTKLPAEGHRKGTQLEVGEEGCR